MRLDGRRESTNVDDRRGKKMGAGLGIGGAIIVGIIALLLGKDPSDAIQNLNINDTQTESAYTPTAEEDELASFTKKNLCSSLMPCSRDAVVHHRRRDHSTALPTKRFTSTFRSSQP